MTRVTSLSVEHNGQLQFLLIRETGVNFSMLTGKEHISDFWANSFTFFNVEITWSFNLKLSSLNSLPIWSVVIMKLCGALKALSSVNTEYKTRSLKFSELHSGW